MTTVPLYHQLDPTRPADCLKRTSTHMESLGTIRDAAAIHNCALLSDCPCRCPCRQRLQQALRRLEDPRAG